MMRLGRIMFGLVAVVVAGCADPVQPELALSGSWSSGQMGLGSGGSWEVELTFTPDGGFTQRVTSYGLYPGDDADDRSAETVIAGTYSVDGDRLLISPASSQWWDSFHDDPGPHLADPPSSLYPDCRFELRGRFVLTLRYTSYPADAPVETERSFFRSPMS